MYCAKARWSMTGRSRDILRRLFTFCQGQQEREAGYQQDAAFQVSPVARNVVARMTFHNVETMSAISAPCCTSADLAG